MFEGAAAGGKGWEIPAPHCSQGMGSWPLIHSFVSRGEAGDREAILRGQMTGKE